MEQYSDQSEEQMYVERLIADGYFDQEWTDYYAETDDDDIENEETDDDDISSCSCSESPTIVHPIQQEVLVDGFIRHESYTMVPDCLKELCWSYYRTRLVSDGLDQWNRERCNSELGISVDGLCLSGKRGLEWRNACGTIMVTKGEVMKWKIKLSKAINNVSKTFSVIFGVCDVSKTDGQPFHALPSPGHFADQEHAYGYYTFGGGEIVTRGVRSPFVKFDRKADENYNTIEMTLDLRTDTGVLSYAVNEGYEEIAFANLNVEVQYVMALSRYHEDIIRIIPFETRTDDDA